MDFMPHGHCYMWRGDVLWLNVLSDALIALSYFSIPVILLVFLRRTHGVLYPAIIALFAAFILACGVTHLMEIWNVWHGEYLLAGGLKAITAGLSLTTALAMLKIVPAALQFKSPKEVSQIEALLTLERTGNAKTERLLVELEERFRLAFENSGIGMALVAPDGRWLKVNKSLCEMVGYSESELLEIDFQTITQPEDLEKDLEHVKRLLEGAISNYSIEKRYLRKDGRSIWVQLNVSLVKDLAGAPEYFVSQIQDITESKQIKGALVESESFNRLLLEHLSEAVVACDGEGKLTTFNKAAREWHGADPRKIPQEEWSTHYNLFESDGKTPLITERIPLIRAWNGEAITSQPMSIVARNQEPRYVIANGGPVFDIEGEKRGAIVAMRDISEERAVQQELRQALMTLEATDDGVFMFEPKSLRFSYVNDGAAKQVGLSREALLKLTPLEIAPEFNRERFSEIVGPLLEGKRNRHRFITNHRHSDGHDVAVEVIVQCIQLDDSEPRFVAISRDISDRLKTEQYARRAQRLESIGQLAGGVAHDLNNALAPIMMATQILQTKHPDGAEMIQTIETSAKRGADMVKQLLTFAKGTKGEKELIEMDALIKEVRKIVQSTFPKAIDFTMHIADDLWTVVGDGTQLHQVLVNLCVNARDAMPEGGTLNINVENRKLDANYVATMPEAKMGRYVVVEVVDTGTGIAPQNLERVFDPFFSTKGPDKGTGLGLSTTVGIIKGHGGFVRVYSQLNMGTTFSVYLPASETIPELASGAVGKTEEAEFRGTGETVLVVDDEQPVLKVASNVLESLNLKAIVASDGAKALVLAAEHRNQIKLVLTDLHMPNMDGLTLIRSLRHMLPKVPVIVASGRMDECDEAQFKRLGVSNILPKPFTQESLEGALKRAFEER